MKKLILLFLSAAMLLATASCGSDVAKNSVFSASDLSGKNIGVVDGTASNVYAQEVVGSGSIAHFASSADLTDALRSGEIDCAIMDSKPGKSADKKSAKLVTLKDPLAAEEYSIAVAKENIDLTEDMNDALDQLTEDGTLDSIVNSYISGTDYKYKSSGGEYENTISLAVNGDFPPYAYYEDGELVGMDIDIARAVCDILGVRLEVVDLQGGDIVSAVRLGKATFGMGRMVQNDTNAALVDFTAPYTTVTQLILVRKR